MPGTTCRLSYWKAGMAVAVLAAGVGTAALAQDTSTTADTTPVKKPVPTGTRGGSPTAAPYDEMAMNDDAARLIRTLIEEKSEIRQLVAQQAAFRRLGGRQNLRIANLLGRMAHEHEAAGPRLVNLIRRHAGNPELAVVRKSPVLGTPAQMLAADHQDHVDAVINSVARARVATSADVRSFLHMRANLARKHIRQMQPYMRHSM